MLSLLHIENIAVVERAEIPFGAGFHVLTGETGAGKSIVIDALGAVLGGRVNRELVRTGAAAASVTAVFADIACLPWFAENGIDCEDELFLQRKITAEGKSSCRVNGTPVSAGQLRALGEQILDIHGQHDGQLLLHETHHLRYLDSFGGDKIKAVHTDYKAAYDAYRKLEREFSALQMDEGEKARRLDTLRFQIEELEGANLQVGEAESLQERRRFLQNAESLSAAVNESFEALYGDSDAMTPGALDRIYDADKQINYAATLSDNFSPIAQSLTDLRYGLEDIIEQLRDVKDKLEFSPAELDELEERLALLSRLRRKYGNNEAEMLAFLEQSKTELDEITFADERAAKLEEELAIAKSALENKGRTLAKARLTIAKSMETRITAELRELNMPGVRFAVEISPQAPETSGMDAVRFLMSANRGEKLGKMSKVASGGELARIMLALKNVLAESESISTMVFDEVDTGVSGIAAQRVGEKMCTLAVQKQVLCVTHLPQIAALADTHYLIEKSVSGERTYTQVTPLDREGRKRELARLSGGDHITDVTLQSASEQLEAAEAFKVRLPK